jgi:hypothetical protein
MSSAQLAKKHRHKLAPTGESSGMPFGFGFFDHLLELGPGKELQELAEYATKPIHNRPSFVGDVGFLADPNLSHNAARAYFLNPNLDKPEFGQACL